MPFARSSQPKPTKANGYAANGKHGSVNGHAALAGSRPKDLLRKKEEDVNRRIRNGAEILGMIGPLPDEWIEEGKAIKKAKEEKAKKAAKQSGGTSGTIGTMFSNDHIKAVGEAIGAKWHTPEGLAVATINHPDHVEHLPVRGRSFGLWCKAGYYRHTDGRILSAQTLQDYIGALEGQAVHEGPEHPLFVRTAAHDNSIYIDLANAAHQVVHIDATDWRILSNKNIPIRFGRPKGMLALPVPVRGGSVNQLRQFANVSEQQWPLFIGFTVGALRAKGPYAIEEIQAAQGDGKTTNTDCQKELIDPNAANVRAMPKTERDLAISAANSFLLAYDNLSYIPHEMSDALCRLSSGGGVSFRELYTNSDETIFSAARPLILNGIENCGTRSDLLDRKLILTLPRIKPIDRISEELFWQQFEEAQPAILGAIYTAVSCALRRLPEVKQLKKIEWPRLKDFAQWVHAAEPALEMKSGTFLRAYKENRLHAHQIALEGNPIVPAIEAMLKRKKGGFQGMATALLDAIGVGQDTKRRGWPKSAAVLSGMLNRLAPNLRAIGIDAEQIDVGSGNKKHKEWLLSRFNPDAPITRPSPKKF